MSGGTNIYPLAIGKTYRLCLPDGRILGSVRIDRFVEQWAEGPFTATADFETFRELFEQEAKLRHEQIIGVWEGYADKIEALKIAVIGEEGGNEHPGLIVYIEGEEAIINRFRPGPLPRFRLE